MVTTRPPKTIVKPTALGPVANTDTKLLIYGLFQKGRVLAQDGLAVRAAIASERRKNSPYESGQNQDTTEKAACFVPAPSVPTSLRHFAP